MGAFNLPPDIARAFSTLADRVAALERTRTIITVTADPTGTAPEGAVLVNKTNGKLWVGYGGVWHFVTLT